MEKFLSRLKRLKILGVDTNFWIYHFEDKLPYSILTEQIFLLAEKGELKLVGSTLLLVELLPLPLREKDEELTRIYLDLAEKVPGVELIDLDSTIAAKAAELRAKYNLKSPDSIHLATAVLAGAEGFITNDEVFQKVKEIKIFLLKNIPIQASE